MGQLALCPVTSDITRHHSSARASVVGPSLPIYQIEEIKLIGGSMFVASASDKANLVGQFESEKNAKEACKRDFADKVSAITSNQPAIIEMTQST
jgi:hypothetical protein